MHTIIFEKTLELRKNKNKLEEKLNIELNIKGKKVTLKGESLDEYEATLVLDAINFGFSAQKALLIKEQGMLFRIINIKKFTQKKNLEQVRSRAIGKQGKTKKTIEHLTNSHIVIKENEIGIIGAPESINSLITALTSLIRGKKQSTTYAFLEKQRSLAKERDFY